MPGASAIDFPGRLRVWVCLSPAWGKLLFHLCQTINFHALRLRDLDSSARKSELLVGGLGVPRDRPRSAPQHQPGQRPRLSAPHQGSDRRGPDQVPAQGASIGTHPFSSREHRPRERRQRRRGTTTTTTTSRPFTPTHRRRTPSATRRTQNLCTAWVPAQRCPRRSGAGSARTSSARSTRTSRTPSCPAGHQASRPAHQPSAAFP